MQTYPDIDLLIKSVPRCQQTCCNLHVFGCVTLNMKTFFSADPGFQFIYVLFWGAAVVFTLSVVFYYGHEFVNEPLLVHKRLKDKNV